ncbi:MAG: TadE family protein [Vampirovibrionales bacterium]|nr:TadE family protein [Vampirovibrionales bacterium]
MRRALKTIGVKQSPRLTLAAARGQALRGQAIVEAIGTILITSLMMGVLTGSTYYLYVQQVYTSAARDAARMASLNAQMGNAGTQSTARSSTISYVQDYIEDTLGQTLGSESITVTPPVSGGTVGNRQVTVEIETTLDTPVVLSALMDVLGASDASKTKVASIPVYAKATMRYEE